MLQQVHCKANNLKERTSAQASTMTCQVSPTVLDMWEMVRLSSTCCVFHCASLAAWCPSTLPCCETTLSDPVHRKMLHSLLNTCETLAIFWLVLWPPVDKTLSACSHARSAHHLSVKHFDSCGAGQRQAEFLREFCHCHVDHGMAVSLGLRVQGGAWQ